MCAFGAEDGLRPRRQFVAGGRPLNTDLRRMKTTPLALTFAFLLAAPALSADSVVLGIGISNRFLSGPPCQPDPDDILKCWEANYVWILRAKRTVVGPRVTGTVRAILSQHVGLRPEFVKSVELFVLSPIEDQSLRISAHAGYYLVDFSSKDSNGRYCLWHTRPEEVGLHLKDTDVVSDAQGRLCFRAKLIAAGKSN